MDPHIVAIAKPALLAATPACHTLCLVEKKLLVAGQDGRATAIGQDGRAVAVTATKLTATAALAGSTFGLVETTTPPLASLHATAADDDQDDLTSRTHVRFCGFGPYPNQPKQKL